MFEHIIFYDHECPLCHRSVKHIIDIDVHKRFLFAPLKGETAKKYLTGPQSKLKNINSMVLLENYDSTHRQFWVRSKAVFRTYWLTGNGWGLVGILSFLPAVIGDPIYAFFASHRHQFKLRMKDDPGPKDRLLP